MLEQRAGEGRVWESRGLVPPRGTEALWSIHPRGIIIRAFLPQPLPRLKSFLPSSEQNTLRVRGGVCCWGCAIVGSVLSRQIIEAIT